MADPGFDDISDPLSLHKYVYAKGDPVDGVDLSGHLAVETAALDQVELDSLPGIYAFEFALGC